MNKCKFKIHNKIFCFYKVGKPNWTTNLMVEWFEFYRLSTYVIPKRNLRLKKTYDTFHKRMKLESTKKYVDE